MNDGQFTPQAAGLWSAISEADRTTILANVFCANCRTSVRIVNIIGEERDGDVYLFGKCLNCGGEVRRLVETSEADKSKN
jgi:hypothetical protein